MGMIRALTRWLPFALVPLALAMVALMMVPARFWHHPLTEAAYDGFDPNLLYQTRSGSGSSDGIIKVSPQSVVLTALPGSEPTVDLVTTPLSFQASLDARIISTADLTTPLRIGLWSPGSLRAIYLTFQGSPDGTLVLQTASGDNAFKTLLGEKIIRTETLGAYFPAQPYRISLRFDKRANTFSYSVKQLGGIPFQGRVLSAGDPGGDYEDIRSTSAAVQAGKQYVFGGWVRHASGTGPYAIGILWYDRQGRQLPFDNWWRQPGELSGWTSRRLEAVAPQNAAKAVVFLGSASASNYLFGDVVFAPADQPGQNLIQNGEFEQGSAGWKIINKPGRQLQVRDQRPLDSGGTITSADFPEFFTAFRPTLFVSAESSAGTVSSQIENYHLTLPSQPQSAAELVEKTDDGRARILTLLLLVAGSAIGLTGTLGWLAHGQATAGRSMREVMLGWINRPRTLTGTALLMVPAAVVVYLVGNSWLFHLGSPHFDVFTPKIWSYIAAKYSFLDLYHRPLVTTAAGVQGGIPLHDAVFPYGPTKAYYYLAIGWIYSSLFSAPGPLAMDTFQLEFLIKFLNVLFALADGLLTYLILARLGVAPRSRVFAVGLILLNPAVWFVMSIWGSTETISLFFILLSVWFAEKRVVPWAWIALAVGAFTRPQMLVVAFLLGIVYLRKFPVARNLVAISWSIVAFFLLLGPFLLALGPSMPFDYVSHILAFSVGTAQADPAYLGTSPGYYSVWTLALDWINHQHGLERMWYPRTAYLFGAVTYAQASAILSVGWVLLVGLFLLLSKRVAASGDYVLVVAVGMIGWLMVTSNLVSRYFIYGLVLLILSRKSVRDSLYYTGVAAMSTLILVTSWGHLTLDIIGNLSVDTPLHPANSALTRVMLSVFADDRFITLGALCNVLLLTFLTVEVVRLRAWPPEASPAEREERASPRVLRGTVAPRATVTGGG